MVAQTAANSTEGMALLGMLASGNKTVLAPSVSGRQSTI